MNKPQLIAIAASALSALASIATTPTVVPEGETFITNVTGEATLDGQWIIGGMLCKTGGGTLTIPAEKVWFARNGRLDVLDGAVNVTSTTGTMDAFEEPAAAQGAGFWVKAGVNFAYDGSGNLVRWLDRRDSAANASPAYMFAKSMTNLADNAAFPEVGTDVGKPYVSFGGYGSGRWMHWRKPDDSDAAWLDIANVFVAYNPVESHGNFLGTARASDGNTSSKYQQHYAVNDGAAGTTLFCGTYSANPEVYRRVRTGRVFVDGVRKQPTDGIVFNARQVIEVEAGCDLAGAEAFFNFRNYQQKAGSGSAGNRVGGGRLHEVIAFTNRLDEADRLLVEAYLVRSWVSDALRPPAAVVVANGAKLSAPAGYLASSETRFEGAVSPTVVNDASDPFRIVPTAVAVAEGDAFTNRALLPLDVAPGLSVAVDASRQTMVSAGTAGRIAKTGAGDMALAPCATPALLAVSGGKVALASPETALLSVPATNANFAVDGGFECNYSSGTDGIAAGGKVGAWTSEPVASASVRVCKKGEWNNRLGAGVVPEGEYYLHLKDKGGVSQVMDLPCAGRYEVSFQATTRNDYDPGSCNMLSVKIDDFLLACVPVVTKSKWERWRFVTPYLPAGAHTLRLAHELSGDKSTGIDDVRVVWVDDLKAAPIPNAGFECLSLDNGSGGVLAQSTVRSSEFDANRQSGWTFGNSELVKIARHATPTAPTGSTRSPAPVSGGIFNVLLPYGAAITNIFTVAESGTYRFSALFAKCGDPNAPLVDAKTIEAVVTVNGEREVLGVETFAYERAYGTKTFALDAGDTVTLSIASEKSGHRFAVDDIVFERCGDANLLRNPSFEEGDDANCRTNFWDVVPAAVASNASKIATYPLGGYIRSSGGAPISLDDYYGASVIDGNTRLALKNRRSANQTVTLPEAGLYRLSFWTRSRVTNGKVGYGPNDLDVFVVLDGATNTLGRTAVSTTSTEFMRHEYRFAGAAGAECKVVFQGVAEDTDDKTSFIDAVSLMRVGGAEDAAPLATESELDVAAGARLALNYTGIQTVGRMAFGGRSFSGELSAAAVPDYLEGPGLLFVQPSATVITFR